MPDIDQEHLSILEGVQDLLFFFETRYLLKKRPQFISKRLSSRFTEMLECWNELGKMRTEKFVPKKIAGPQQVREDVHAFLAAEVRNDVVRQRFFGRLIEKLIEVAHRLGRIGRFRQ